MVGKPLSLYERFKMGGNGSDKLIITDASNKLVHRVESKKNSNNKNIIEAIFNSKSNLIQKKNIGYNLNGKIARIHDYDMLKPEANEKPKLINIITYEYK